MAAVKKDDVVSMFDSFKEFKETKNIDRTTLVSVLEESFRNVLAKIFGSDENFDVIVNPDKGDFEIYRNRVVVADGEVEDENKQVSLTEARKIEPDYEVGEDVSERVDFAKFGRRAILNLRQTLASKILELEHDSLYNKYKDRVGQVIAAEVYQVWKREVLVVDDENNELILPKAEQIPADSPAKVSSIKIDEENKKAEVYLKPEEVSLAIGRSGLNIKLASLLTEYTIDVFREVSEEDADEDIYLDEFADEIDQWVIDAIKGIGLDTAKAVLNAPRDMLVEKADLEEETVDNVLKVLRAEFE